MAIRGHNDRSAGKRKMTAGDNPPRDHTDRVKYVWSTASWFTYGDLTILSREAKREGLRHGVTNTVHRHLILGSDCVRHGSLTMAARP